MNPHFRNAIIRSGLAIVLVIIWVTQFDGPSWAWAFLAVYIVFSFGAAMFIQRRIEAMTKKSEREE